MKKQKKTASKTSGAASKSISTASTGKSAAKSAPKTSNKIQPLGDRVLLKPFLTAEAENKNNFGIIIPETVSKESPERGTVIAVGEGRYDNGKVVPLKVKV